MWPGEASDTVEGGSSQIPISNKKWATAGRTVDPTRVACCRDRRLYRLSGGRLTGK